MRPSPLLIATAAATLLMIHAAHARADDEAPLSQAAPSATEAAAEAPPASTIACPSETGSRIKRRKGYCSGASGRVFQGEELQSTGQTAIGDALRRVDPTISGSPGH